ncbi:MAG: MFS transporter [Geminicoccales bacterium]
MALLRDRVYGPFFFGNLVSNCGNWIHNVAAAVVVFELTDSAVAVGAVTACMWAASLLLQPWAGALTDRYDRRRMLIAGQTVALLGAMSIAIASVAAGGAEELPGPWPIYIGTLVIGLGVAFSIPAMQALIPALVTDRDLDRAIALNGVTFNLARGIGPAIAGVILLEADASLAFSINVASFAVLLAVMATIRPRFDREPAAGDRSVLAGLRWVRADRRAIVLLATMVAIGFATDPINTLTPPMAEDVGGGEGLVGLMVSGFGAGAVIAAFFVDRIRDLIGRERAASTGLATLGAAIGAFAFSEQAAYAVATLAFAGAGFIVAITSVTTQLQARVPDLLRGRVMALWGVAFLGTRPVSAGIDGAVADLVSPRAAALTMAVAALAAALVQDRESERLAAERPPELAGTEY